MGKKKKGKKGKAAIIAEKPRKVRRYDAARFDRLSSDWLTTSSSADSEIYTSLRALRNRSRDLVRNNPYIKAAIDRTLPDNIVGRRGFDFQSQVKRKRGNKLDDGINRQIEEAWKEWTEEAKFCHTAGKLCFTDICKLIVKSMAESGEVLIRVVRRGFGGSPIPIALEVIEADQLVDTHAIGNYADNLVKMGVELDEWGRPVAYHLYPYHPGDTQFTAVQAGGRMLRIPAEEIFHLFISDRPGQTRGVPWLHAAMSRMRQLGGFEEATVVTARGQSMISAFVKTLNPESLSLAERDAERSREGSIEEVEYPGDGGGRFDRLVALDPGTIQYLQPGEEIQGFIPTNPNQNFDPFVRAMLRSAAVSIGVSYEGFTGDFSNASYSAARTALLQERDHYQAIQDWLIKNFLLPFFKEWLETAVLAGVIRIDDFFTMPKFYCCPKFTGRGWDWVDPYKDVMGNVAALESGQTTLSDIAAKQGRDFEEMVKTMRRERDLLARYGITLASGMPIEAPPEEEMVMTEKQWREKQRRERARSASGFRLRAELGE